ncbi:hypothetical protein PoB_001604600 [Plakobranchus ocellatus]|uniref:Uncharacterized protein n=1 Tax=Plakobranchus ocellatus TaxID=259542 RepID=A0AAV3YQW4_9GAST|nr:hypothetical protein PoB_001604600 [Plakobranchus ocellatus]
MQCYKLFRSKPLRSPFEISKSLLNASSYQVKREWYRGVRPWRTMNNYTSYNLFGGVGGTVASESALRSAETLLSRVRVPPPAPWPNGAPESLRSPCYGLAINKNRNVFTILCLVSKA